METRPQLRPSLLVRDEANAWRTPTALLQLPHNHFFLICQSWAGSSVRFHLSQFLSMYTNPLHACFVEFTSPFTIPDSDIGPACSRSFFSHDLSHCPSSYTFITVHVSFPLPLAFPLRLVLSRVAPHAYSIIGRLLTPLRPGSVRPSHSIRSSYLNIKRTFSTSQHSLRGSPCAYCFKFWPILDYKASIFTTITLELALIT